MKYLLLILVNFLLVNSAFAESILNTSLKEDSILQVSYNIKGKDADTFFEQLTDSLKSGKKVKVFHKVTLQEKGWFGNKIIQKKYTFPLTYDLLQNLYIYDKGGVQASNNIKNVKSNILSLENLELISKNKLIKGKFYRILIEIYTKNIKSKHKETSLKKWLNKVPLPSFSHNKLTYEVPYIVY